MAFKRFSAFILIIFCLAQSTALPAMAEEASTKDQAFFEDISKKLEFKLAQLKYRKANFKSNLQSTRENYEDIELGIKALKEEILTLQEAYERDFRALRAIIESKEKERLEMESLQEALLKKEKTIQLQEKNLQELIILLQQKEALYADESIFWFQVMVQDGASGEILSHKEKLEQVKTQVEGLLRRLENEKKQIQTEWQKSKTLQTQYRNSVAGYEEKATLSESRLRNKEMLYEELEQEKYILQANLDGATDNEKALSEEIAIYSKNISQLTMHIEGKNDKLSPEERALLQEIEEEMRGFSNPSIQLSERGFSSPLEKGLKSGANPEELLEITATFIDSAYQNTFGVQHYALDLRATQGTPILSVADGVVESIAFDPESTKYAYIKIVHPGKTMTVYGHISEPLVHVGQFVRQGEPIALSGGQPGSPGAGARTTGPHLHFEVWQDGLHVDPLLYLPLSDFLLESLPELFQKQWLKEKVDNTIVIE